MEDWMRRRPPRSGEDHDAHPASSMPRGAEGARPGRRSTRSAAWIGEKERRGRRKRDDPPAASGRDAAGGSSSMRSAAPYSPTGWPRQYHPRSGFSLPSSGWDRVGPPRCCHRPSRVGFEGVGSRRGRRTDDERRRVRAGALAGKTGSSLAHARRVRRRCCCSSGEVGRCFSLGKRGGFPKRAGPVSGVQADSRGCACACGPVKPHGPLVRLG